MLTSRYYTLVLVALVGLGACKSDHPDGAPAEHAPASGSPSAGDGRSGGGVQPGAAAQTGQPGRAGGHASTAEQAPSDLFKPHGYTQKAQLRDLPGGVVDGDTFKAVGFSESLRLLNINTEELLHRHAKAAQARADWPGYVAQETAGEGFETFGTPMGEAAKKFARRYFDGIDTVWLEYQSPTYTHGFFGRHLVYVWTKQDGSWRNYNLDAVRAGMSAYYTKYGPSIRYDAVFKKAQRDARQQHRGIWAAGAKSYPDYPERMAWWNERAKQIAGFRRRFDGRADYVDLGSDTAFSRLRARLGRRVVVFGHPKSFAERGNPQRIRLTYRYRRDFPVVAFEPHDMRRAKVDVDRQEYIYVEGVVTLYRGDPQLRWDADSWMRSGTAPPVE